jgi:hypothetical protein
MALGSTQFPLYWVGGVLSQNVKWQDYEFEHLQLSSAKIIEYVKLYFCSSYKPSCRAHGKIYLHIFSVQRKRRVVFVLNLAVHHNKYE